jgi:hypothetical protein
MNDRGRVRDDTLETAAREGRSDVKEVLPPFSMNSTLDSVDLNLMLPILIWRILRNCSK